MVYLQFPMELNHLFTTDNCKVVRGAKGIRMFTKILEKWLYEQ